MNNPDYKMYPHLYNVLTQKGQHMPPYFQLPIDPYDSEANVKEAESSFEKIKFPTYTGAAGTPTRTRRTSTALKAILRK